MSDTWHHFEPDENDADSGNRYDPDTTVWWGLTSCQLNQSCPECRRWRITAILRPVTNEKIALGSGFVVTQLRCSDPFVECRWGTSLQPAKEATDHE